MRMHVWYTQFNKPQIGAMQHVMSGMYVTSCCGDIFMAEAFLGIERSHLNFILNLTHELTVSAGAMQSSCTLQHVPVDLERETKMDAALKKRLAFAKQKLVEIVEVAKQLSAGKCPSGQAPKAVAGTAAEELQKYDKNMTERPQPYEKRRQAQFSAFPKVRTSPSRCRCSIVVHGIRSVLAASWPAWEKPCTAGP